MHDHACACAAVLLLALASAADVILQPDQGPVGTEVIATRTAWPINALVYAFFGQQRVTTKPAIVDPNGSFTLNSLRVALGSKLPSIIFECPDKLLLFRIDRNDRLVGGLKFLDLLVNMLKLGIAIRRRTPLKRLVVGLQAVAHLVKELGYQAVAGLK
jgi:hypothetical protein